MGFSAFTDGITIDISGNRSAEKTVRDFINAGGEIYCPECRQAKLTLHKEAFKISSNNHPYKVPAHFATMPDETHASGCTYSKAHDEDEGFIRIYNRHFGISVRDKNDNADNGTDDEKIKTSGHGHSARYAADITSVTKFKQYLSQTVTDPSLKDKEFIRGKEKLSWNDIYFDERNIAAFKRDVEVFDLYRFENEAVFVKFRIKQDDICSGQQDDPLTVKGEPYRCMIDGRPEQVCIDLRFKDEALKEEFLKDPVHIIWGVPFGEKNKITGATKTVIEIHGRNQFEPLSDGHQLRLNFKKQWTPERGPKA